MTQIHVEFSFDGLESVGNNIRLDLDCLLLDVLVLELREHFHVCLLSILIRLLDSKGRLLSQNLVEVLVLMILSLSLVDIFGLLLGQVGLRVDFLESGAIVGLIELFPRVDWYHLLGGKRVSHLGRDGLLQIGLHLLIFLD